MLSPKEKFDAMKPIEVSSTEVRALGHGEGFVKRALDWLTKKGALGDYRNVDKGWEITIDGSGVRSVLSHGAGEGKVALLEYVPDLIMGGIFLETTPHGRNCNSHIFAAKANLDGKPYVVGFVVREANRGKRYYDHTIIFEEAGWAETWSRETDTAGANPPNNPTSVLNILKKHLKVNNF
ncbi:MAG: hypothetical protein LBB74_06800 [Chitinispirillales bacterium]|jgi:hypothetical protein|nr:hypothetical protein [Chitinispirillales bacterium]